MKGKFGKVLLVLVALLAVALLCSACGSTDTLYIGPGFAVPEDMDPGTMICFFSNCWGW
jgi:hypothetical protein